MYLFWDCIFLISVFFDFVKESKENFEEKTKTWLDGLLTDFPEVFYGLSEIISTMVTDLWNIYKDALGYENALIMCKYLLNWL